MALYRIRAAIDVRHYDWITVEGDSLMGAAENAERMGVSCIPDVSVLRLRDIDTVERVVPVSYLSREVSAADAVGFEHQPVAAFQRVMVSA